MKRIKVGLLIIVGLIITSMTVYDMLPYRERNYITHSGSATRSYDLVFNSTTQYISIDEESFIDIQDPFPNSINNLTLSSSIDVSYAISSHNWTATLYSPQFLGYVNANTTHVNHYTDYREREWFMFYTMNMTDFSCVFSYTANYTVEMIYSRPPKTYAWATLFSFLDAEGVVLVGVVIFASVLIYVGTRLLTDS
ncbi:MAG: hypothetical protein EAX87_09250 [Candidatus Thorarchaeota archaeon]|nr:hypothetical protein [Candidatus Thorarchaeota archaeon]